MRFKKMMMAIFCGIAQIQQAIMDREGLSRRLRLIARNHTHSTGFAVPLRSYFIPETQLNL
jgi:hypothetical protein